MAAYSTSSVNMSGNTGTVVINISEKAGGGDIGQRDVEVVVSINSSAYTFTGGNPPETSTFGNNGARWSSIKFTGGTTVNYSFASGSGPGADYVVMITDNDTDEFDVHWGTIPGETILSLPMMMASREASDPYPSNWRKFFKRT